MDLSALLQAMTQQTGQPESPLFGPTMPFQQQAPPPMPPMPQAMPEAAAAPGLPMGPPPPMAPPPPNPLGFQPVANDWKAQLPQLLMAIAGLAGAGNNPYGAAAYMHGFQQTQLDQEDQARRAAEHADVVERLKREDAIRQQQIDESHADRVSAAEELRRQHRSTFISGVLENASKFDDPEQAQAYLKSMAPLGAEFGINTSALPLAPNPTALKRTQTAINDAFDALVKQHGDKVYEPGFGDGVSMDVLGKPMSATDVIRRQSVLSRTGGAITPPPPETGSGAEGSALRDRYIEFRDDPKRGNGKWPGASDRKHIRDQMIAHDALTRHLASQDGGEGGGPVGEDGKPTIGGLTDEGIDFAATMLRLTGAMPPLGMGKTPARGAIISRAAAQARLLHLTPAAAMQKAAAFKADRKSLGNMQTLADAASAYESKAQAQLDIVDELSSKVPRSKVPLINQAWLSGQTEIAGDPEATLLLNAIVTATSEYSKIIAGGTASVAAASDSARNEAQKLLKASFNHPTLLKATALMRREMALTNQGYAATIDHINQRMSGEPTTPEDRNPKTPSPATIRQGPDGMFIVTDPDGLDWPFKTRDQAERAKAAMGAP